MLCENCSKKNATSILMSPNGNKLKYLCGECYKILNNSEELEEFARLATKNIKMEVVCKNCGTKFKDFECSGLFGCEKCYIFFSEYVKNNIICKFKEQKYLGRKPNLYYVQQDIKNLEQLIELCIKNGNFQKATQYGKELETLKEGCHGKL